MQTITERGLVEVVGRAEVVGRPQIYGTTALFLSMWGMSGSPQMWIGGTNGTILKFDGTNFTAQKTGVTTAIRTVWGNNLTDVWAAGDTGTILRWKM